jgi:hypothetical protein
VIVMIKIARVTAVLAGAALFLATLAPAAAAETTTRPFNGSLVGGAVQVADASCPFGVRTDTWGSGQLTHFGLTSMTASHCTQFLGAPETGTQTFVAANGDTLQVTYTLTGEWPEPVEGAVLIGQGQTVITGGTGRFAQASGEFVVNFRGILHLTAPSEVWLSWGGEEIAY